MVQDYRYNRFLKIKGYFGFWHLRVTKEVKESLEQSGKAKTYMVILAVDDERLALENLAGVIRKVCDNAEVYPFLKAKDALIFAEENVCDVAFLDIEMREINGIDLAKELKRYNPQINIVFTTGYSEYATQAFDLRASGYVMKPVTEEKIKTELEDLRHKAGDAKQEGLWVQTFGSFEVFYQGKPLEFKYTKTKELFAYLIDRNGALCTNSEMISILWEDVSHAKNKESYFKNLRTDLTRRLKEIGCEDILLKQWGRMAVIPERINCDFYDWMSNKPEAVGAFRGEYMVQYSWSEFSCHRFK